MQHELVSSQRVAQISFQQQSRRQAHTHVAAEELVAIPAMLLGFVHGSVGLTQQAFRVLPAAGIGASPDAHVDIKSFVVDDVWGRDRPQDFSRGNGCVFRILHLGEQYHELVSAHAAYGVRTPDTGNQAPSHRAQQLVSHRMAQRIVDSLELIQIDKQHRELIALAFRQ